LHVCVYCRLFIIVKLGKKPRCPVTDEWIKKMWYIYAVEFIQPQKRMKLMLFAGKSIKLEKTMLSEESNAQKEGMEDEGEQWRGEFK
jgi:hypothetical protein